MSDTFRVGDRVRCRSPYDGGTSGYSSLVSGEEYVVMEVQSDKIGVRDGLTGKLIIGPSGDLVFWYTTRFEPSPVTVQTRLEQALQTHPGWQEMLAEIFPEYVAKPLYRKDLPGGADQELPTGNLDDYYSTAIELALTTPAINSIQTELTQLRREQERLWKYVHLVLDPGNQNVVNVDLCASMADVAQIALSAKEDF